MIQFIASLFIGGAVVFVAMCYLNVASSNRIDEGPMLPEVDEHGRTVYRPEVKQ